MCALVCVCVRCLLELHRNAMRCSGNALCHAPAPPRHVCSMQIEYSIVCNSPFLLQLYTRCAQAASTPNNVCVSPHWAQSSVVGGRAPSVPFACASRNTGRQWRRPLTTQSASEAKVNVCSVCHARPTRLAGRSPTRLIYHHPILAHRHSLLHPHPHHHLRLARREYKEHHLTRASPFTHPSLQTLYCASRRYTPSYRPPTWQPLLMMR